MLNLADIAVPLILCWWAAARWWEPKGRLPSILRAGALVTAIYLLANLYFDFQFGIAVDPLLKRSLRLALLALSIAAVALLFASEFRNIRREEAARLAALED